MPGALGSSVEGNPRLLPPVCFTRVPWPSRANPTRSATKVACRRRRRPGMALPPIRARRVQSRGLWVPGTQEPVSHRWQSYGGRRGTEVRFIARRWVPGIVENGTVRVGSIVIDVDNFDRMMAFWQAALRYVPVRPPTPGDRSEEHTSELQSQ